MCRLVEYCIQHRFFPPTSIRIDLFSFHASSCSGLWGVGVESIPKSLGERWGAPWTVCKSITELDSSFESPKIDFTTVIIHKAHILWKRSCISRSFLANLSANSPKWPLNIADIFLPITLMTSGWAALIMVQGNMKELVFIVSVAADELFMVCLKLLLGGYGKEWLLQGKWWEEKHKNVKGESLSPFLLFSWQPLSLFAILDGNGPSLL